MREYTLHKINTITAHMLKIEQTAGPILPAEKKSLIKLIILFYTVIIFTLGTFSIHFFYLMLRKKLISRG